MACKINWTNRAWLTYEANLRYLEEEWTEKEISHFVELADRKIFNLSHHPNLGSPRNKNIPTSGLHWSIRELH